MPPFNPSPVGTPSSPENNEVKYENFNKLKEVTGGRIDISSFLRNPSLLSESGNKYLDTITNPSKSSEEYNLLELQAKERDAHHLAKMLTEKDHWHVVNDYDEASDTGERFLVGSGVMRPLTNEELEGHDERNEPEEIMVHDNPGEFEQERESINKSFDDLVEYFAALPRERQRRAGVISEISVLLEALTDIYLDRVPSKPVGYGEDEDVKKLKRLVSALYPDGIKNPRGDTEKRLEEFRRNYFVMGKEDQEKVEEVIMMVKGLNEIQKRYLLKQVSSGLDVSTVDFTEEDKFD